MHRGRPILALLYTLTTGIVASACITVEQGAAAADGGTCVAKIAGPKAPSNVREVPAGGVSWRNPARAASVDGTAAECDLTRGAKTNTLVFEGFGFNVPANARITGVEFSVTRSGSDGYSNSTRDLVAQPLPSLGGKNVPMAGTWGTSSRPVVYGGSAETFGVALTPSIVNSVDLAMAFAGDFNGPSGDDTLTIDGASARVFYCE